MPKHSARWAFLWQLIAKNRKRRLALHTALRTVYQRRQLEVSSNTEHLLRIGNSHLKHLYLSFVSWNTKKKHFHRAVPCQPRLLIACHHRSRNCLSLYSACSSGGGGGGDSVWQMFLIFLWRLRSPSHVNQLFTWFMNWSGRELSACYRRIIRLGKRNLC